MFLKWWGRGAETALKEPATENPDSVLNSASWVTSAVSLGLTIEVAQPQEEFGQNPEVTPARWRRVLA